MEEVGKLLHWDAVPAGECKKQGKEQYRPCQVTVPAGIRVGHIWEQTSLGEHITLTGRSENEVRLQEGLGQTTTPAITHWGQDKVLIILG